jgi:hypothetical protein
MSRARKKKADMNSLGVVLSPVGSNYGQLSRAVVSVAGNNCSADGLFSIKIGSGESNKALVKG